jgi:CRISPR-associated protein Cas2
MPMTTVVTRNAEPRVRGFLASCMLEIANGVYASPNMTLAVRERVWAVLQKWDVGSRGDGVVMVWPGARAPGGMTVHSLGEPSMQLRSTATITLSRRELSEEEVRSLTTAVEGVPFLG